MSNNEYSINVISFSFILVAGGRPRAETTQVRLTDDVPGNPLYGQRHSFRCLCSLVAE